MKEFRKIARFLSRKEAKRLADVFQEDIHRGLIPRGDGQCPNSYYAPDYYHFLQLLCDNNKRVGELIGEPVFPTYCYARSYTCGDQLLPHTDREACEVSLSINLHSDKEWPIYMEPPGASEPTPVFLSPGDAVIYNGNTVKHWREAFEGTVCMQVFLHYVRSHGPHCEEIFDRKMAAAVGVSKPFEMINPNRV